MTTFVFLMGSTDPEIYSVRDDTPLKDKNIPIDRAIELAEVDPIWAQRGKAIQAYAFLESALSMLFASVADISPQVAGTIFYKITNTASRNSILEKLIVEKHGAKYNPFWNSYLKELRVIDLKRNEIVHWLAAANINVDNEQRLIVGVTLMPPNIAKHDEDTPRVMRKDLKAFQDKCDVFARIANMFAIFTKPDAEPTEPWLGIFQQPFLYPPPEGHPILRKRAAPQTPPQPSETSQPNQ
jgi:hypothetical protein